jgi:hypothetical protein
MKFIAPFRQWGLALLLVSPLCAAPQEVPWSRSTNGKWALFRAKDVDISTFSFATVSDKRKAFAIEKSGDQSDATDLMLDLMSNALDSWDSNHQISAEIYHIDWSPDSTMVAVEAGAHKFMGFKIYRRHGDRFTEVKLPEDYENRLIDFVKSPTKIHAMGVTRFASHASPFGVGHVQLLDHGYIAVNTYGAQCDRPFQELPEDLQDKVGGGRDLYFLFHADPACAVKFIGFCH